MEYNIPSAVSCDQSCCLIHSQLQRGFVDSLLCCLFCADNGLCNVGLGISNCDLLIPIQQDIPLGFDAFGCCRDSEPLKLYCDSVTQIHSVRDHVTDLGKLHREINLRSANLIVLNVCFGRRDQL